MQRVARLIRGWLWTMGAALVCAAPGTLTAQTSQPDAASSVSPQPATPARSASATLVAARVAGVTPGMSVDQLVELGARAIDERRFQAAEQIFRAVLEEDNRSTGAMTGLAIAYEAEGQRAQSSPDPAISAKAAELTKAAADWFLSAAPLLAANGDTSGAERAYQRVLALRPGDPSAQLGLARAYIASGRDLSAMEAYGDYLNKFKTPNAPPATLAQANLELAQVRRRQRLPAQAMDALQDALRRDRENPAIYIEMARTYKDMSQLKKAQAAAETANTKSQGNPEYLSVYAEILLAQKEYNGARQMALESIRQAGAAVQQKPDSQSLLAALSRYYGTYQQVLQTILAGDPTNTPARVQLARAIQENSTVQQALALYQSLEVLNRAPAVERRNPILLEANIDILTALYRTSDAQAVASQLQQIDPRNETARRVLAQAAPSSAPASQTSR